MLAPRAAALALDLLPNGRRNGRFWETSSVDDVKTGKYSLKVNLSGANQGKWTDFAAAKGTAEYKGDMLSLVALRRFGGKNTEALRNAIAWAKSYLNLDDLDPARLATVRREAAEKAVRHAEDADAEKAKKQRSAWALWRAAVSIGGTPAFSYLEGRGIDFKRLGRIPGALRYRPDVWCPERRAKHPAMIACIMGLDGKLRGVHRTYLDISRWSHATRKGPVGKAKVENAKLSLGPYAGGCIPLWKGACQKTLRDIDPGVAVFASEGLEDGLSVAIAKPELRVVAGVALANLGALELPPQAGPIVFIGQNDTNPKTIDAFERAIARQQEAGRKAQMFFPPPEFKDFNDQLMGKRRERA